MWAPVPRRNGVAQWQRAFPIGTPASCIVALLSLAVGLSLVTPLVWHVVSLRALWFGAGFTVLTALTWLYAYNIVAHDTLSHTAMTGQRNWVIATLSLFLVIAAWAQV